MDGNGQKGDDVTEFRRFVRPIPGCSPGRLHDATSVKVHCACK